VQAAAWLTRHTASNPLESRQCVEDMHMGLSFRCSSMDCRKCRQLSGVYDRQLQASFLNTVHSVPKTCRWLDLLCQGAQACAAPRAGTALGHSHALCSGICGQIA